MWNHQPGLLLFIYSTHKGSVHIPFYNLIFFLIIIFYFKFLFLFFVFHGGMRTGRVLYGRDSCSK